MSANRAPFARPRISTWTRISASCISCALRYADFYSARGRWVTRRFRGGRGLVGRHHGEELRLVDLRPLHLRDAEVGERSVAVTVKRPGAERAVVILGRHDGLDDRGAVFLVYFGDGIQH